MHRRPRPPSFSSISHSQSVENRLRKDEIRQCKRQCKQQCKRQCKRQCKQQCKRQCKQQCKQQCKRQCKQQCKQPSINPHLCRWLKIAHPIEVSKLYSEQSKDQFNQATTKKCRKRHTLSLLEITMPTMINWNLMSKNGQSLFTSLFRNHYHKAYFNSFCYVHIERYFIDQDVFIATLDYQITEPERMVASFIKKWSIHTLENMMNTLDPFSFIDHPFGISCGKKNGMTDGFNTVPTVGGARTGGADSCPTKYGAAVCGAHIDIKYIADRICRQIANHSIFLFDEADTGYSSFCQMYNAISIYFSQFRSSSPFIVRLRRHEYKSTPFLDIPTLMLWATHTKLLDPDPGDIEWYHGFRTLIRTMYSIPSYLITNTIETIYNYDADQMSQCISISTSVMDQIVISKNMMMLSLLVSKLDIHYMDDYLLRAACRYNFIDGVRFLLSKGANVHQNENEALDTACRNDNTSIIALLKEYGASFIKCYFKSYQTFLHAIQIQNDKLVQAMLDADLHPNPNVYGPTKSLFMANDKWEYAKIIKK